MQANLSSDPTPPSKILPVGLAFTISNLASRQNHLGLVYAEASDWKLIHQTGAKETYSVDAAPSEFYVWVDFSHKVEALLRDNLAGLCSLLAKREKESRLPFGYSSYIGWIRVTGEIADAEGRSGLTCAAFVLSVLDACHIDWLKIDTWPIPISEEDAAWQKKVAEQIGRREFSRLDSLLKDVGNRRYKPEQVGGAGLAAEIPCGRENANEGAALVVERALALRTSSPASNTTTQASEAAPPTISPATSSSPQSDSPPPTLDEGSQPPL